MAENANGYRRGDTYQCGMAEGREDEVSPAASLLYAGPSSSVAMPALRPAPFAGPLGRERFTFIDLFAGIGGFRLGLQQAGGRCVFSSEWDRYAQQTYRANFGEIPYGDITQEETKGKVPAGYDVLAAGFPCQPFSISGHMRGFEDTRGTLVYEVFDIAQRTQPRIVLLENVKHLKYHDKGHTLHVITESLRGLGYGVSWGVLNASDFGVPQNRERIIIVGIRGGGSFDFSRLLGDGRKPTLRDFLESDGPFEYLDEPYTLLSETRRQPSVLIFAGFRNKKLRKRGILPGTEHLSRVHKQPNRIYDAEGVHPALPSQEMSGRFWILVDGRVRKLTIAECYRIMGFPNGFRREVPLAEQYREVGNSICVPMVAAIGQELLRQGWIEEKVIGGLKIYGC